MRPKISRVSSVVAGRKLSAAASIAFAFAAPACSDSSSESVAEVSSTLGCRPKPPRRPPASTEPVGIALEIDEGQPVALKLRAGQKFYIDQIDLLANTTSNTDRGVNGLKTEGAFSDLRWGTPELADEEFLILPNDDGTFTRRRFYRNARWMQSPSVIRVEQVDNRGRRLGGPPSVLRIGPDRPAGNDSFFIRRMRAIQWAFDCPAPQDCSGAQNFLEEGLVELRHAQKKTPFSLHPATAALRLTWTQLPRESFLIPVEQVAEPEYAYGFSIDLEPLTPPRHDGTYAPGSELSFRITLKDGAGQRLHEPGSLPTYNEATFGPDAAGIRYYQAFFDPSVTYYRRKHRERMMMAQIIGPAQSIQPIRSIVALDAFFGPDDPQYVANLEQDGVFSAYVTFPIARNLFGGAFDPEHLAWDEPVSDTWSYVLPENAPAGTYLITAKARRVYLGQDIPFTRTIEVQVGSPVRTEAQLTTGPCTSCHSGGGDLSNILHANDDRAACSGCHAPLAFEYDAPVFVRTHFIHSRSNRYADSLSACSSCHLTQEGIQRTSQAACLSCHSSYPESHVVAYGPIENPYVGGGADSFQQCSTTCHVTHPNSGL